MAGPSTDRYPTLDNVIHPDAAREIRVLFSLVYKLQSEVVALKARVAVLESKGS